MDHGNFQDQMYGDQMNGSQMNGDLMNENPTNMEQALHGMDNICNAFGQQNLAGMKPSNPMMDLL